MTYSTARALRLALEQRLLARSKDTGVNLDRLRRRVVFERTVARLQAAEPEQWVVKGGMALEVRLQNRARLTKDLDLGLRDDVSDGEELQHRLVAALSADPDDDRFIFSPGPAKRLADDSGGHATWRVHVDVHLADKPFGGIQLDVSPRAHELLDAEAMTLPNSLDFAGIPAPVVEVIDVARHAAEKFHAMLQEFGDRENTRVRDLVDILILREHDLIDPQATARAARQVWAERDDTVPPQRFPPLPAGWPDRYEQFAAGVGLEAVTFAQAVNAVTELWTEMFPTKEN
jgi:hypothetical protein